MGFLLQKKSWLRALSKGVGAGAGPGRWCCELAERTSKTGGGAGRALVSADCALCGGVVSWLRTLRAFLVQPVACQQVVGFCLAIWVYAGVIFYFYLFIFSSCCISFMSFTILPQNYIHAWGSAPGR